MAIISRLRVNVTLSPGNAFFTSVRCFDSAAEVDSLKRVISRMEQTSNRSDETYKVESDAAQSIKEKPPATWYKWLLVGFVGGLLLTSPLKKLKNRILTFLK